MTVLRLGLGFSDPGSCLGGLTFVFWIGGSVELRCRPVSVEVVTKWASPEQSFSDLPGWLNCSRECSRILSLRLVESCQGPLVVDWFPGFVKCQQFPSVERERVVVGVANLRLSWLPTGVVAGLGGVAECCFVSHAQP